MKSRHSTFFIVLAVVVNQLLYCQKATPPVHIVKDIAYNNINDAYAQKRCKLDLYVPQNRNDFPTLVWFHGGGLREGSKEHPWVKDLCE